MWLKAVILNMIVIMPVSYGYGQKLRSKPEATGLIRNKQATVKVVVAGMGHGSAVAISKKGLLLTCHHVVSEGVPLTVSIEEGAANPTLYKARVLAKDKKLDLAVIRINRRFSTPAILEDIKNIHEGDKIYNIGYPYFFRQLVGVGYIAALRYTEKRLELKNAILVNIEDGFGMSGSGVFMHRSGRLIGIMSRIMWISRKEEPPRMLGILIPIDEIKKFLKSKKIRYLFNG